MSAQKRLLSLLLALCMVLALVPAAFAEDDYLVIVTVPKGQSRTISFDQSVSDITGNDKTFWVDLRKTNAGSTARWYGTFRMDDYGYGPNNATTWTGFAAHSSTFYPDSRGFFDYANHSTDFQNSVKDARISVTVTNYDNNTAAIDIAWMPNDSQTTYHQYYSNIVLDANLVSFCIVENGTTLSNLENNNETFVGLSDCSSSLNAAKTPYWTVGNDSKSTFVFTNYNPGYDMWRNFVVNVTGCPCSQGQSEVKCTNNFGTYQTIHYNGEAAVVNYSSAWNNTFNLNGAVIELVVENEGGYVTVTATKTADSTAYASWKLKKTESDSDITFSVGVDNSYLSYTVEPTNESLVSTPTTYTVTFTTNTAATVRVYSDEEKTTQVGENVVISSTTGTIDLEGGTIYYYTATPANTTLYEVATDQFTVTDSSNTVVITMTQKAAPVGGYLYTSNADIRASLQWNIYFVIDDEVISEPTSAVIRVTSDYDKEIRKSYTLQEGEEKYADYYFITVPIRPRLIGKDIGLTLTYDGADYKLKMKESGTTEYETVSISFSQYLNSVMSDAVKEEDTTLQAVVTALREYQSALEARWPVSVEE